MLAANVPAELVAQGSQDSLSTRQYIRILQ